MSNLYAVIMAGGVGSRFWPRSRERKPKQLLEIIGNGTMIQNTVGRIRSMVPDQQILVVTNRHQSEAVHQQLPFLPPENILVEPIGRNTAPCIGLAACHVRRRDPQAVMVVLPADHLIRNQNEFLRVIEVAKRVAVETDALITIGIKPTHPETGYGYIQIEEENSEQNPYFSSGVYRVKTFAEKPNLETAERFLQSGDFLWNSGMFVWKANAILNEIRVHLPDLFDQLMKVDASLESPAYPKILEEAYGLIRSISVDYGVMEKAGNVYVVKGDFGWSDVGSWDEVVRLSPHDADGNAVRGKVIVKDAARNFIDANGKIVAAVGVEDLIVIVSDDAVLICKKGRSQDVKEVVDYIRRKQMNDYL
jgi:mannose-1-phosphate guanylyltransferase